MVVNNVVFGQVGLIVVNLVWVDLYCVIFLSFVDVSIVIIRYFFLCCCCKLLYSDNRLGCEIVKKFVLILVFVIFCVYCFILLNSCCVVCCLFSSCSVIFC